MQWCNTRQLLVVVKSKPETLFQLLMKSLYMQSSQMLYKFLCHLQYEFWFEYYLHRQSRQTILRMYNSSHHTQVYMLVAVVEGAEAVVSLCHMMQRLRRIRNSLGRQISSSNECIGTSTQDCCNRCLSTKCKSRCSRDSNSCTLCQ